MTYSESILLETVQGVTELIPVSSSGQLVIAATALTGFIGILFKDRIHALFQSVEITASMLLITGLLLLLSDKIKDAKFSFLLSIPAIMGATILESACASSLSKRDITVYGCGFLIAAVT